MKNRFNRMRSLVSLFFIIVMLASCIVGCSSPEKKLEKAFWYKETGKYEKAFKNFSELAEAGNAEAQNELGLLYYNGHGVEQNRKKANEWFQRAADGGNIGGMENIGTSYLLDEDADADASKGFFYLNQAAELGSVYAQNWLAYCLFHGKGIERDITAAYKWWQLAAENGDPYAMGNIGNYYYFGYDYVIDVDYGKAFEYYSKSAEQGADTGLGGLARCYYDGNGVVQDISKAREYAEVASEYENPLALLILGDMAAKEAGAGLPWEKAEDCMSFFVEVGEDYTLTSFYTSPLAENDKKAIEAFDYYKRAKEADSIEGAKRVAYCHATGFGTELNSDLAAAEFEKLSVRNNNSISDSEIYLMNRDPEAMRMYAACSMLSPDADYSKMLRYLSYNTSLIVESNALNQQLVAICYHLGYGIDKDLETAYKYYEKSANNGRADSMVQMGVHYQIGDGVKVNMGKAAEYYRQAADKGNREGEFYLGRCYYFGEGVEQNLEEAFRLWQSAADKGNMFAKRALGVCYYYGKGTKQDYFKAIPLFEEAAELGDGEAMYMLGLCYMNGNGVETDSLKARAFLSSALSRGFSDAEAELKKLSYAELRKAGIYN